MGSLGTLNPLGTRSASEPRAQGSTARSVTVSDRRRKVFRVLELSGLGFRCLGFRALGF